MYSRLAVELVKKAGVNVVLDGTFLKAKRRANAERFVKAAGISYVGIWVGPEAAGHRRSSEDEFGVMVR